MLTMNHRQQDDNFLYGTDGFSSPIANPKTNTTADELGYDTLKNVRKILTDALEALGKDYNSFTIARNMLPADRAAVILHETEVRQAVYSILSPTVDTVINAINRVNSTNIK